MNEFLLIAGMGLVTMATRIPVLIWLSQRKLPDAMFRALRYVPPAVLAAIIVPTVLLRNGQLALELNNPAIVASLVAVLVSWRTRNLLLTIILGMAALLVSRAVFGS